MKNIAGRGFVNGRRFAAEQGCGPEMTAAEFAALLPPDAPQPAAEAIITRASALRQMLSLLPKLPQSTRP